jgi:hypothetical protein
MKLSKYEKHSPNKKTEKAIRDANKGKGLKTVKSVDSLLDFKRKVSKK